MVATGRMFQLIQEIRNSVLIALATFPELLKFSWLVAYTVQNISIIAERSTDGSAV